MKKVVYSITLLLLTVGLFAQKPRIDKGVSYVSLENAQRPGADAVSAARNGQTCSDLVFNQDIELLNFSSEGHAIAQSYSVAEDFTLSSPASINSVLILAVDFFDQVAPALQISFRTNTGNLPGEVLSTQLVPAGAGCYARPAGYPDGVVYKITTPIATVNLEAGTYWLEITTPLEPVFIQSLFWQTTASGTGALGIQYRPGLPPIRAHYAFALCTGSPDCDGGCPELAAAPGEVQITNSTCTPECTLTGGSIASPATGCPEGSVIQYRVDEGAWSQTLPTYNTSGPAQMIQTRCLCEEDEEVSSPASAGVLTAPGVCDQTLELSCLNSAVTFNGQENIPLVAANLVNITSSCPIQSVTANPPSISCLQVGQVVPVTITVTNSNNVSATCTSQVTVSGLNCGWGQDPDGVGCEEGSSIAYNSSTGVWTATSTDCYYAAPFTSDATAFAQRTLCGNGSITALVTGIDGNGWAGVVMRESNAPGAKKAQLMTNLSNFSRREFRTTTNGQAFPQQFPSQNRYWLRIVRTGNQFTLYTSSNGQMWSPAGSQMITMSNCIVMGLAATNYNSNSTVTANFSNVSHSGNGSFAGSPGTGIQSALGQVEFELFPNPTTGELKMNLTQYLGRSVRAEVYSIEGKLLKFMEIDEVETAIVPLSLFDYSSGMYLISIKSEGLPDAVRKVILK